MELYVCRYVQPSAHYTTDAPFYVPDRVLDVYSSLIWCERYQGPGEFVLILRATQELMQYFCDNELLILRKDTGYGMIPEIIELTEDPDAVDTIKISGRSAESLLNRRVITQTLTWNENTLSGTAANAVTYFTEKNVSDFYWYHNDISGMYTDKYRYLPFLGIHNLTLDAFLKDFPEKITAQPFGENLGVFASETAKACGFGYRILTDRDTMRMTLEVYVGADRSMEQDERAPVIFAPGFAELGRTVYTVDRRGYYNVGYAGGEGDGKDRMVGVGLHGEFTNNPPFYWKSMGVPRREYYVDAKSISSNSDGVTDALAYQKLLDSTARAAVDARGVKSDFFGEALPGCPYRYRMDYFLGDRVSVRSKFGISGTATITEVTETIDGAGHQIIPTLSDWRE